MNTQKLRKQIRSLRRQYNSQTLMAHSRLMSHQAKACRALHNAKRIAFYLANDGEMDPTPLLELACKAGKTCYLPILRSRPSRSLWFGEYKPGQTLALNRFGIPEPITRHHKIIKPWGLDVVIMPLVAFDLDGNRLGMGGGFYDRSFAYKKSRSHWKTPKLIGVAHEIQRVSHLPSNPWDIPLNGVITEQAYYSF
jgi:5-formyltetrahydrofolate cyclo-ligase